ncbi:MAG: acetate kinase [Microbacteriaceae bacterium]
MSRAFIVNSGSSSIKYQLIDLDTDESVLSGLVERIGEPGGDATTHTEGLRGVLAMLGDDANISVVGHRVVHGGDRFDRATVVTDAVLSEIESLSPLAPLHNPANLAGIRAAREVLVGIPHVAVFDTAFHQTMPAEAYLYALDTEVAREFGVRKYGFHGTSHKYVTARATAFLGREPHNTNLVVCHLGNGSSVTAIQGGRSVDTSMGLTPLQGLVMGTRTGDIDAAVVTHLHRVAGMTIDDIDDLLNKRSGMVGLTGKSDMRDVEQAVSDGDERASVGLGVWRHRIRHYIGAYVAQLGRVDAVVFTAGIGENSSLLRELACQGLEHLGIELDASRNDARSRAERDIATDASRVRILVIPTNEELEIAHQAVAAL